MLSNPSSKSQKCKKSKASSLTKHTHTSRQSREAKGEDDRALGKERKQAGEARTREGGETSEPEVKDRRT